MKAQHADTTPSLFLVQPASTPPPLCEPQGGVEDFSWRPSEDAIVCFEQPATAVYRNTRGQIVIRQQRAWDEDDDTTVIINIDCLPRLIEALKAQL